jgi:hypothetical protein
MPASPSPGARDDAEAFYAQLIQGGPDAGEAWAEAGLVALPDGFRMGVWLDVGGSLASHAADHASRLSALAITDACIMINGVGKQGFAYSLSKAKIRTFVGALDTSRTRVTLTSWLRPKRAFIDALVADLPAFAEEIGAIAIEFDAEEPWTRADPKGFHSHDEAAGYLFDSLRANPHTARLEIATTCQVDQIGTPRMQRLLNESNIIVPQAYSTKSASASHRVGGTYGPRGLQGRAADRVTNLLATSGATVVMGLAAYNRTGWSGQSARDIMRIELEAAVALRGAHAIEGVRYWSWKHIAGFKGRSGSPANSYAGKFLEDLV